MFKPKAEQGTDTTLAVSCTRLSPTSSFALNLVDRRSMCSDIDSKLFKELLTEAGFNLLVVIAGCI